MPMDNGKVVYSEVKNCDNLSKQEIARRARMWMIRSYIPGSDFVSLKDAIYIDDLENGEIVFKGRTSFLVERTKEYNEIKAYVEYTLILEANDNRYRVSLRHISLGKFFDLPVELYKHQYEKRTLAVIVEADKELRALLPSLAEGISQYKPF